MHLHLLAAQLYGHVRRLPKRQPTEVERPNDALQHLRRARALQRDEPPAVEHLVRDRALAPRDGPRVPLRELRAEPREVLRAAARVRDDVERARRVLGDDRVVDDPAGGVEEHGERGGEGRERGEVGGREPFEEGGCGWAAEAGRPDSDAGEWCFRFERGEKQA